MFVAATEKDLVLGLYSLPLLAPPAFHFYRCSTWHKKKKLFKSSISKIERTYGFSLCTFWRFSALNSISCLHLSLWPLQPKGPERRSKRGFGPAKAIPQCFSSDFFFFGCCHRVVRIMGSIYVDFRLIYITCGDLTGSIGMKHCGLWMRMPILKQEMSNVWPFRAFNRDRKRNMNRLRGYSESNMARANTAWCKRKQNSSNKKNTTNSTTCLPVFAILAIDCQALNGSVGSTQNSWKLIGCSFQGTWIRRCGCVQPGVVSTWTHLFHSVPTPFWCQRKCANLFQNQKHLGTKMRKFLSVGWPSIHLSHLFLARIPVPKSWNHLGAGSQRHSWGTANCQHHQHTLGV